jgi:tRNA nucleotidyltransferase/poly(A) polymerase
MTADTGGSVRLDPPREVRRIAARLTDAGFETWCVGGAVRDALLGQSHADWDLATSATPPEVRALFDRTVPLGIEFGTVGVIDRQGVMHEVTTFRRDVQHDGRHAVVEYGVSLDDDLARRDFTINAIAYSPATDEIRDPFGGREDLRRGTVRAVGDADARMVEDRLRALRALRFAGRYGFDIDGQTWSAIVASAPFLPRLSRERVRQEIEKTMDQVRRPSTSFMLWQQSGAFRSLIPELHNATEAALRAADHIGTPDATRRPERAEARKCNRLATLFLDLAPADARRTLEGLRSSNRVTVAVTHQVKCWHDLGAAMRQSIEGPAATDATFRRWVAIVGRTHFGDFMRIAAARWVAEGAALTSLKASYQRGNRIAWNDPLAMADLAIDGADLLELGVPAGPAIGATLRRLLDVVIEDPSRNQREVLLELARPAAT